METETLDKLYLEWSQFTKAKTAKELMLEREIENKNKEIADLKEVIRKLELMGDHNE